MIYLKNGETTMNGRLYRYNRIYFEFLIENNSQIYDVLYLFDETKPRYGNDAGFLIEKEGRDISFLKPDILRKFTTIS